MAVIINATNAIQLCGSLMAKVLNGGRKKKLKQTMPTNEAMTAGREPHAVATNRMIRRNARATVVALMCSPNNFSKPVAARIAEIAAQYPNNVLLKSLSHTGSSILLVGRQSPINANVISRIPKIVYDCLQEQQTKTRMPNGQSEAAPEGIH